MGNLLSGSAELVDGRSNAVGTVGLLVGVDHRGVGGTDHAQGHFVDLLGRRGHFADRGVDTFDETVEGSAQDAKLVLAVNGQAFGQVAFTFGNVFHSPGHGVQWLQQHTDQ
ncbi:hypothetical protein D3C78_783060 [compost metagenome]